MLAYTGLTMPRENEYKLIGSTDNTLAHLWWDGESVICSSKALIKVLEQDYRVNMKGGPEELTKLANKMKNGYLSMRKVT